MNHQLALPIGISDFRGLRESAYFYVDKSKLIEELLNDKARVTLITRPRRFGKTLAMTMVRDFFDLKEDSREIFSGLAIMDSGYAKEINSTPVIFLSFKDCKGNAENAWGFDLYTIKIPNKEVRGGFQEIVGEYTGFGESRLQPYLVP